MGSMAVRVQGSGSTGYLGLGSTGLHGGSQGRKAQMKRKPKAPQLP